MKRLIAAICVLLSISTCALAETCVRVGELEFPAERIGLAVEQQAAAMYSYGMEPDADDIRAIVDQVVDDYIVRGLIVNRAGELKLNDMTEAEIYALQAAARRTYEQTWQSLRKSVSEEQMTDEQLTLAMNDMGYTQDSIYSDLLASYCASAILEYYHIDCSVTDEEVERFYTETYAEPYREAYEQDIRAYEEDILFAGGDWIYTPEGYLRVEQIVLPLPEDIVKEISGIETRAEELIGEMENAYTKIAEKAMAGEDVEDVRTEYAELKAEYDALGVKHGDAWAGVLPLLSDNTKEIYTRLNSGESFETLRTAFSPDAEDIFYHPLSAHWPDEYVEGLAMLKEPGDVAQPIVSDDGVHIFMYAESVPGGMREMTDEERDVIRETAEGLRISEKLKELTDPWREEYDIEIDLSGIDLSGIDMGSEDK